MIQDTILNDEMNLERLVSIISLRYKIIPSEIERMKKKDVLRMYSYIKFEYEQQKSQTEMNNY